MTNRHAKCSGPQPPDCSCVICGSRSAPRPRKKAARCGRSSRRRSARRCSRTASRHRLRPSDPLRSAATRPARAAAVDCNRQRRHAVVVARVHADVVFVHELRGHVELARLQLRRSATCRLLTSREQFQPRPSRLSRSTDAGTLPETPRITDKLERVAHTNTIHGLALRTIVDDRVDPPRRQVLRLRHRPPLTRCRARGRRRRPGCRSVFLRLLLAGPAVGARAVLASDPLPHVLRRTARAAQRSTRCGRPMVVLRNAMQGSPTRVAWAASSSGSLREARPGGRRRYDRRQRL